ncbi:hypothetical protein Ancab_035401 [Ancistrocladus abbreviatus]
MLELRFLDFQYKLSKSKLTPNPCRLFSTRSRQNSGLQLPVFMPNAAEMKKVFDKFDSNRDGKISQEEYMAILRAIRIKGGELGGRESVKAEVAKIFEVVDVNGDGYIDFKEFMELHETGGGVRTMDIQRAFRAFDFDEDGKISAEEVLEMLTRLGERCTLEDCKQMVRAVDVNGDGAVDMDEFITMMTCTMTHL